MRATPALVLALLVLAATSPAAGAAPVLSGSSVVFGEVQEKSTNLVIDAYELRSEDEGRHDLAGSAADPDGTAQSGSTVDFAIGAATTGERLTAEGAASGRSGLPVRNAEATSHVEATFALAAPGSYSIDGMLSRARAAGQCCAGAHVRLLDEDDEKVFEFVLANSAAQGTLLVDTGGPLPAGEYTLQMEASVGLGGDTDTSASAGFDLTFDLAVGTDGGGGPPPGTGTGGPGPGTGSPSPAPAPGANPPSPPPSVRLTALAVRPATSSARRRTRIVFTLTAAARVRFTVERLAPGHRRGGRCRAGGRGPACLRAVRVGGFARDGRAGVNRVALPARLGGRRLKPGRYRLAATPAGGSARRVTFRLR